jgi:hypothetical protein
MWFEFILLIKLIFILCLVYISASNIININQWLKLMTLTAWIKSSLNQETETNRICHAKFESIYMSQFQFCFLMVDI